MEFVVDIRLKDGTEKIKTVYGVNIESAKVTAGHLLGKTGIVIGITELADWMLKERLFYGKSIHERIE